MTLPYFVDGQPLTVSSLNALIVASGVTTVPPFVVGEHPQEKLNLLRIAGNFQNVVPPFDNLDFFTSADLNPLVNAINALPGVPNGVGPYELPIMSQYVLGGAKVGDGLTIDPLTALLSLNLGAGLAFDPTTRKVYVTGTIVSDPNAIPDGAIVDDYGNPLVDDYANFIVIG